LVVNFGVMLILKASWGRKANDDNRTVTGI
jgi:hypothetical protein